MKTAFTHAAAISIIFGFFSETSSQGQSANFLTIKPLSNQTVRVTCRAPTGGFYALQAARLLSPDAAWLVLTSGSVPENGLLEFLDNDPGKAGSRFYRALAVASLFPTTGTVTGREDETFTFTLDGIDPQSGSTNFAATITQLPAHGQLFQFDQTPITNVPTVLTDPARRGKFLAQTNKNGHPYTSFRYNVGANGMVSPEGDVEVIVTPVPDAPLCQFPGNSTCAPGQINRVQTQEDTPVVFALGVTDPDLDEEGDAITVYAMPLPPSSLPLGRLYQLQGDGVTRGDEIVAANTVVTHPKHLLMYVPPPDGNGCPLAASEYWAQDSYGLRSDGLAQVLLDVAPVNDPPVARPRDHSGSTDILELPVSLDGYDVDNPYGTLALRLLSLPEQGTLVTWPGAVPIQTNTSYPFTIGLVYQLPLPQDCNQQIPTGAALASFTWSLTDPSNLTAVATDTISIWPGNQRPTPVGPASVGTIEHDTNGVAIALGGTDPEGYDIIPVILALPQHGQLKSEFGLISSPGDLPPVPSGGSRTIIYVPDPDFASDRPDFGTGLSVPDSFRWTVRDNPPANSGIAPVASRCEPTVTLYVTNVNDPPIISGPASGTAHYLPGAHTISAVFTNITVVDPDDFLHTGRETFHVRITSTLADRLILRNAEYGPFPGNNTPAIEFDTTPGRLNRIFTDGLEFVPAAAGAGSITIEVNDLGFAGLGGPQTAAKVITLQVLAE